MTKPTHFVYAETDELALLETWGGYSEGEGHDFFLVYDENDGHPKPVAGREMTKKFRLTYHLPEAEVSNFTASLEEAGFGPVFSQLVVKPSPGDTPDEIAF